MSKSKAALLGGVALFLLGLLTSLLTRVLPMGAANIAGCCSCLWPVAGGLLAVYLYLKRPASGDALSNLPPPMLAGEGAVLGGLAGIIGGLINFLVFFGAYVLQPERVQVLFGQLEDAFVQAGVRAPTGLFGWPIIVLIGLVGLVLNTILAAVGGTIGVSLFEKRKDGDAAPPAPPPPPDFSATPGPGNMDARG